MTIEEDVELARAFAMAIVRPGGGALLIEEDNRSDRWVTVEEAVTSGKAFAVEPHDHLLGVDLDEPEDRGWVEAMREGLTGQGCRFIDVASGREGHSHLWVLLPPGWTYEYAKSRMEAVAGKPRTWQIVRRNAMRPPYSPHRLGGRSALVAPGTGTALKWLREGRSQGIPDLAGRALWWLDPQVVVTKRGVIDRGRTIHRAAVALVNARCTESDLTMLLKDRVNAVTSKYHEMPAQRRADYVETAWKAACTFVRSNPPQSSNKETVARLRERIPLMEWGVRTGPQDRKVYGALLDIGEAAASLEVDASIRRLAELTCLSTSGVQAALRRLSSSGHIERLEVQNRLSSDACSYRLPSDLPAKSSATPHTWPYLGGPKAMCAEEATFLDDIFSNGSGLGLSTRETWEALPTTPTKASEVAKLRPAPLAQATVLEHLRKLNDAGLAGKKGHRWWRLLPDVEALERLAQLLGVRNKAARKAARYQRERIEHRRWLSPDGAPPPATT